MGTIKEGDKTSIYLDSLKAKKEAFIDRTI